MKTISHLGPCIVWTQCLPTKFHQQRKRSVAIAMQDNWIKAHEVFLSEGRVYADIGKFIMDAVTGTLFYTNGRCVTTQDLNVNVKDKNYDKAAVTQFVRRKY